MKPVAFDYVVAAETGDALRRRAETGAGFVAGNQSLGPMLNLRLARPEALIDLSMMDELRAFEESDQAVTLGAAITHAEVEDGEVPDPTDGWMRQVAANIAYRAVRNRGTLGGSLCHADPAADWVTVLPALGANALILGADGPRRMALGAFITGPYTTALGDGEILQAIEVPKPGPGARWGYWKYVRQVGEFAKASAAVLIDPANDRRHAVVGALGRAPCHLRDLDAVIAGRVTPAACLTAALSDPPADLALHTVALTRALAAAGVDMGRHSQ